MKPSTIGRKYGWKPEPADFRDHKFSLVAPVTTTLPRKVDLRSGCCPVIFNQGSLGSCTANAIAAHHQYNQILQGAKESFTPSRLFIYFNERELEGTIGEDSGAMIRDGIKTVAAKGVCPETEWAYDIKKYAVRPSPDCYTHALSHQVTAYQRLDNTHLQDIKVCLAAGFPFVFGFTVYENFETAYVAKTGIMDMPHGSSMGGHAVMAVGYDDDRQVIIVRNSWGDTWGDKGYFYMPYAYVTLFGLVDDLWTIRNVELEYLPEVTCQ